MRASVSAALALVVLLALAVGGLGGYVLGRRQAPGVAEEEPEKQEAPESAVVEAPQATVEEVPRTVVSPPPIDAALREVEAEDAETRDRAIRTLFEAGFDHAGVLRLVVRPTRPDWEGRAMADLMSSEPYATLPPLLHRLTHSAPVQRAVICRALGAPREDTTAASATLAVRALLDAFDSVRDHAREALARVDPVAAEAVAAHYRERPTLVDGSAAGLDASLLIEEDGPYAAGRARRMFLQALRAEGARFGMATVVRIAAFMAPLPGEKVWFDELMRELISFRTLDEEGTSLLTGIGPAIVPLLRERLAEPDAPAFVATALGRMGPVAMDAVPELLSVVTERRPIWRAALTAIGNLAPGDLQTVAPLLAFLPDEEVGPHVAWVFGEAGVASPVVVDALCRQLVRRLEAGLDATQAEGALTRLLSQGAGFDRMAALLQHEDRDVVLAAVRAIALCAHQDRARARALLTDVAESAGNRAIRRIARRELGLLAADEDVRETERRMRIAALRGPLELPLPDETAGPPPFGLVPGWMRVAPEQMEAAKKHGVPVSFENSLGMLFVLIPAGTFQMGSPRHEEGRNDDEPQHAVTISQPFYLQATEVTNGQFRMLVPAHSSGLFRTSSLDGDDQPAVRVSWREVWLFAQKLSALDGERIYVLPTEAEWEHACRAGTATRYHWSDDAANGWRYANANDPYAKISCSFYWDGWPEHDGHVVSAPVRSFPPNPWGLYDIHGNAWEWCANEYAYYPFRVTEDTAWPADALAPRVVRGGAWDSAPRHVRAAYRGMLPSHDRFDAVGFRLASPLPAKDD